MPLIILKMLNEPYVRDIRILSKFILLPAIIALFVGFLVLGIGAAIILPALVAAG